MKEPFAYVLYIERDTDEHLVSIHRSLDEAEDALRAFARTIVVAPSDDDITEILAEYNLHARIYACAMKRNTQISTELKPFTRAAKVA
jgi:hypothetical protein